MYLVSIRPDICFAVNILSQFQLEPRHDHWMASKHILRNRRGTIHHCLKYDSKEVKLIGFTNSDWGGSEIDRRSTNGGCFSLGFVMISWMSRKQDPVALSSAEAKYVAACEVGKEAVWFKKLLSNLFEKPLSPTVITCDNQSNIMMSEDPMFYTRTKHIDNKYHYIRSLVLSAIAALYYLCIPSTKAEILTPEVIEAMRKYEAARSINARFSNLAKAFLDKHVES
eukprot:PITA_27276